MASFVGKTETMFELSKLNQLTYFSKKSDFKPYNWLNKEYINDFSIEACLINDAIIFDVFNCYIPRCQSFIDNISYPKSLQHFNVEHKKQNEILSVTCKKKIVDLECDVFVLGGHNNHYHWILNWFPRLLVLNIFFENENINKFKFLVHCGISQNYMRMLIAYGIKKENIICAENKYYRIKNCIIPTFFSSHIYYREVIDFLRRFKDMTSCASNDKPKKFFISRQAISTPRRRVANFCDVKEELDRQQISCIDLEQIDIFQQIHLFSEAETIIACHGAGLANIVFCNKKAKILLFEYKKNSEFEELAKFLDLDLIKIMAQQYVDSKYESENIAFEARLRDFILNINVLREVCRAINTVHVVEVDDKNNIIIHGKKDIRKRIDFRGTNNLAIFDSSSNTNELALVFHLDDAIFRVGENSTLRGWFRLGERCTIEIGKNVYFNGNNFLLTAENTKIIIGDNCLFGQDIHIRTDDSHPIYDLKTGQRVNKSADISIGTDVWIGDRVKILKKVTIDRGSVIACDSLLSSINISKNVIAGGTPCKILRESIIWDRTFLNATHGLHEYIENVNIDYNEIILK